MMDWSTHPIIAVESLIKKYEGKKLVFEFCTYIDAPKHTTPERIPLIVPAEQISSSWLKAQIAKLKKKQEFAITSRVKIGNDVFHMPIVDFKNPNWDDSFLQEFVHNKTTEFFRFKSGSSFHGYMTTLIPEKNWSKFQGRLLLLNEKRKKEIIDTRWVGHSLSLGYSVLRWSDTCKKMMPTLVGVKKQDELPEGSDGTAPVSYPA